MRTAAFGRFSVLRKQSPESGKKAALKISENSQENVSVRDS